MAQLTAASFKELVKDTPDFGSWFWKKSEDGTLNGDTIIELFNSYAPGKNRVRREEFGPYVYGVIVNNPVVEVECVDDKTGSISMKTMKLMKVGYTGADTASDNGTNRMTTVENAVKSDLKTAPEWKFDAVDCSTIFVLAVNGTDIRQPTRVEADIRQRTGICLQKNITEKMCLPVTTEWVLTTQAFVKSIRDKIKEVKGKPIPGTPSGPCAKAKTPKETPCATSSKLQTTPPTKSVEEGIRDMKLSTPKTVSGPSSAQKGLKMEPGEAKTPTSASYSKLSKTAAEKSAEKSDTIMKQKHYPRNVVDTRSVFASLRFDGDGEDAIGVSDTCSLVGKAKEVNVSLDETKTKFTLKLRA